MIKIEQEPWSETRKYYGSILYEGCEINFSVIRERFQQPVVGINFITDIEFHNFGNIKYKYPPHRNVIKKLIDAEITKYDIW
jgi:hypothetical protein